MILWVLVPPNGLSPQLQSGIQKEKRRKKKNIEGFKKSILVNCSKRTESVEDEL